jgi:guanylate kinase
LFDYVLVNDDLEKTKLRLRSVVYAERSRRKRMARVAETLLRKSQELA